MKTIIKNKFDTIFGPAGSSAGISSIIAGGIILFFSYTAIALIIIGSVLAFARNSTTINFKKNRYKFSVDIYGILHFGKWHDFTPEMRLKLIKNQKNFRTYSRSNRINDLKTYNYQVVLIENPLNKPKPVRNINSLEEGKLFINELSEKLNLAIMP
jgi:hypothetical protein